jgi:hypothetical protein
MQKQKMKEWVRDGTAERVRKLSQNGITQEDLNEYHKKGYEEGYLYASEAFLKKIYAAIARNCWKPETIRTTSTVLFMVLTSGLLSCMMPMTKYRKYSTK